MSTAETNASHAEHSAVLAEARRRQRSLTTQVGMVVVGIMVCMWATDMLNAERLAQGVPAIGVMFSEMFPPDFR